MELSAEWLPEAMMEILENYLLLMISRTMSNALGHERSMFRGCL